MEKVENQTAVSNLFHSPLEIANRAIPTFPQRRRRRLCSFQSEDQPARALRALAGTHRKELSDVADKRSASGSYRIGMEVPFQAHLALESNFDFRLICGLENAPAPKTK
jgi:hypothetical protein